MIITSFAFSAFAVKVDPCFAPIVAAGTVCSGGSLYVGSIGQKKYITTPGNCNDLTNPAGITICDGKSDSQKKTWGVDKVFSGVVDVENGNTNTTRLVQNFTDAEAAKFCDSMVFGGYSDWFLPSENEIKVLAENSKSIGSFADGEWYWTSTETPWTTKSSYEPATARVFRLGYGISNLYKTQPHLVRCIRIADPKILPQPEAPRFSKVLETPVTGRIIYMPENEKYLIIKTRRMTASPYSKVLVVQVLDQNLKNLFEIDTGAVLDDSFNYNVLNEVELNVSVADSDKISLITRIRRKLYMGYDITATILSIAQEKVLLQQRLTNNDGYAGFYLFQDMLLTRENFSKNSVFKAYTFDGKLVKQFDLDNYNNIYQSNFIFSKKQKVLNLVKCTPEQNIYYDFFSGNKKFEISGRDISHTEFYRGVDGAKSKLENENIAYDRPDEDIFRLYLWSQIDGHLIGKYEEKKLKPSVFSEELDIRVYSSQENTHAMNGNELHIYQMSTTKEIANFECNCFPVSVIKDSEDGKVKIVVKIKNNDLAVMDLASGKIQYKYHSPFGGKFNDDSKYIGYGRFTDTSLTMHSPEKAYQIVFNAKTGLMDFISSHSDYNMEITYLADDLFRVIFNDSPIWNIEKSLVTIYSKEK